ncbi:MAG: GxxExxY protein [Candidatus Doudnabacteria bacterium]|nr:GxxExxY protein [Candidatus Doudnabacteria bacterium]
MDGLDSPIENLPKITKPQIAALKKLEIFNVRDLLLHLPFRYLDFSQTKTIKELVPEENVSLKVKIKSISSRFSFRGRMSLAEALVSDDTGSLKVTWFNQPYLAKTLSAGEEIFLAGAANYYKDKLQLTNPIYEKVSDFPVHTSRLVPVYHLKAGLYPKTLRNFIKEVLPLAEKITDELPNKIISNQKLLNISETITQSHFPDSVERLDMAKKRLAFEEIFFSQLAAQKTKMEMAQKQSYPSEFDQDLTKTFLAGLPFELTPEQKKSAWEIMQDLEKKEPMNRLLEGDVGSGKTLVALMAALQTINKGYQAVFLAPTEILAKQHFETALKNFKIKNLKLKICLLTNTHSIINGETVAKDKFKKLISEGMPGVYFGTHALLQKNVKFKKLALVIIDEQHRWGVEQRAQLIHGQTPTEPQTDAEPAALLFEDLTYKIRSCVFEVKKELGLGHKEKIYQNALEIKFKEKGIAFEREKNLPIIYKSKNIGSYQPDFIIDKTIIIELKALPFIGNIEKRQAWTYLKSSNYKLALLVNFASDDVHIERIIYDTARSGPSKSALDPRKSAPARVPHLLSLSATPIPRTLKLAFFGELSLSQIKSKPANRKNILSKVVDQAGRAGAYQFIAKEITSGRQAFVITPLVEESDRLGVKSAVNEAEALQKIFPGFKIGLLHGRLKGVEKEAAMADFLANKTQILVATSVVEVGVDVPNASVIVIEGAERFGLSQLHQFRGRVGRAEHQSYCYLFCGNQNQDAITRLQQFAKTQDGFALAELDLKQRGFGQLYGTEQAGWDFKYFDLSYTSLIEPARQEARAILETDLELKKYPALKEKIKDRVIHFE